MFQPNAVIAGRYQVVRLVGQGGMSNLYLAYDRKYSNASVVVKEMTASYSDPKEQQMAVDLFHREAKLLASLNHRHIPKVFDYFQFAGKYYLSMEYIDGVDLAVKLEEQNGPLPEKQVLEWGEQIATVLFYLHKHEPPIVFRDVKPSNIMISSQGVKLIDFGIARHFDQAKKGDTMRIGSPGYAPPEQYAAQTDPRSDIYALGVTLHHALTGRDPTATNTPFLVPPARDLNPALSEATAAMLARACQLDPSDRYQSALELKKDIKHILNRNSQSTRVVGAPPALPSEAKDDKDAQTPAQAPAPQTQSPAGPKGQPAGASTAPPAAQGTGAPAAANQAGTTSQAPAGATSGSGSLAAAQGQSQPPANQTAKPGKKRKIGIGGLLLVACLLITLAGGAYIGNLTAEDRDALLQKARIQFQSWAGELYARPDSEDLLRDALLNGKPEALLPLFQSSEFKELSQEKQELFRLNMLAAGSHDDRPLKMVHILVPEGADKSHIWQTATQVVETANARGGVNRELLVVVPKTFKPGGLELALKKLIGTEQSDVVAGFLVLGGENETFTEPAPQNLIFLTPSEKTDSSHLQDLESSQTDYQKLFALNLDSSSPPTVWGLPGPLPTQGIKPEALDFSKESLEKLLQQSEAAGGRLALLAQDGKELSALKTPGQVLLLAVTPKSLPDLASNQKGSALVLSSPFEPDLLPGSVHLLPNGARAFSFPEARLFDALLLAAVPREISVEGMTLTRNSQGEIAPKKPMLYKWNGDHWLPSLGGEEKQP